MRTPEANRVYLARDVYLNWKRRVSEAEDCITIYSPFFDRLLISLLGNTCLDNEDITIVTDLNPASILELPNQLQAIKHALSSGISVLTISRLHAKVLLTDDKYITTGSQNFTSYGRKSKECTVGPTESLKDTKFVNTLLRWREEAEPVVEDLIDILISKLSTRIKQHKKLIEETHTEFDKLLEEYEHEKQNALIRRLPELERKSRIKMSQGKAYASIKYIYGEYDGYYSLVADHQYNMTQWLKENPEGTTKPYRLNRLTMYPIILAESNRMGFARIGNKRITYIRESLSWTDRKLKVGDMLLAVDINFPKTDTKKRNIVVKLSHPHLGSCKVSFLFTGDAARLTGKRYFKGKPSWRDGHEGFVEALDNQFFDSPEELNSFFSRFFTGFTYNKLGLHNKNVLEYLKEERFRLSIIQFQGNPFLVVKKMW